MVLFKFIKVQTNFPGFWLSIKHEQVIGQMSVWWNVQICKLFLTKKAKCLNISAKFEIVFGWRLNWHHIPTLRSPASVQGRIEYGADFRETGLAHERRHKARGGGQRRRWGGSVLAGGRYRRWANVGRCCWGRRQVRYWTLATPSSHSGLGNGEIDVNFGSRYVISAQYIYIWIQYRPITPTLINIITWLAFMITKFSDFIFDLNVANRLTNCNTTAPSSLQAFHMYAQTCTHTRPRNYPTSHT